MEGNLRFKIDLLSYSWREIDRFCFILVCIWGQFPSISPRGAYIRRGDLTEDFRRYELGLGGGGVIHGGAYFRNFTVFHCKRILWKKKFWNGWMVGKQKSSTRALSLCIHNWQVLSATLEQCYIQYYRWTFGWLNWWNNKVYVFEVVNLLRVLSWKNIKFPPTVCCVSCCSDN